MIYSYPFTEMKSYHLTGFLIFFVRKRLRDSQMIKFDNLLPKQIMTYTTKFKPPHL